MDRNLSDIKIFITREIPSTGIDLLRAQGFAVSVWPYDRPVEPGELSREAKKANALISLSSDPLPASFLEACPHLGIISQFAAGYDNIDIHTATLLGIPVANAPGAMSDATADIAFGLLLAVARKMFYMHKSIEAGQWSFFRPMGNLGMELKNKTLGIFGLGRIGMEMAERCKGAYQMKILYCNRHPNKEAEARLEAQRVSFDELLNQSDIISIHSALTPETKDIFNKEAFLKMKPSAILINTARGGLVNEKELIETLQNGKIWGAGLDVTDPEPMKADNPLLSMPNVAILPHIGSATIEARNEMSRLAAQNIIEFYTHNRIPHLVNPDFIKNKK